MFDFDYMLGSNQPTYFFVLHPSLQLPILHIPSNVIQVQFTFARGLGSEQRIWFGPGHHLPAVVAFAAAFAAAFALL